MSSKAPVSGSEALREALAKADGDANFGFLHVGIDFKDTSFKLLEYVTKVDSGKDEKSSDDDLTWAAMGKKCNPKEHTYFIVRDPTHDSQIVNPNKAESEHKKDDKEKAMQNQSHLYVLIHFAPDQSSVKFRMMYASSRPTLKTFLGSSNFSEDYHCDCLADLKLSVLVEKRTLHHKIDFRSESEVEKDEAALESAPTSASSQVMQSLPIKIQDSAKSAVANYKAGTAKCVLLKLNPKDQSIEGKESKATSMDGISKILPKAEPRYVLFEYKKFKVFGYFCPDGADRKLKFTYSTCKTNLIDYCASEAIEFKGKVEMSSMDDVTDEFLEYHIFPKHTKKELFSTPKAPGGKNKKKKTKKNKKINTDLLAK